MNTSQISKLKDDSSAFYAKFIMVQHQIRFQIGFRISLDSDLFSTTCWFNN